MSYDVWLEIDTGGEYPHRVTDSMDPTYNLGPMFAAALGRPIRSLTGMSAAEALPVLRGAIAAMQADPARFKALNPPNGWGDYTGALDFMEWFASVCADHPKAMVHI